MKNIHVLPTDKPSRLVLDVNNNLALAFNKSIEENALYKRTIYITSDEEIKEGYYYDLTHNIVMKSIFYQSSDKNCKKIILTTDQDLIKDGVQAINDEFLEWFVKNPSCEDVEVLKCPIEGLYTLIPKEEETKCYCGHTTTCDCGPEQHVDLINSNIDEFDKALKLSKQETLEEAAERRFPSKMEMYDVFKEGAKWQQERNEEDLKSAWDSSEQNMRFTFSSSAYRNISFKQWLEKFKKK